MILKYKNIFGYLWREVLNKKKKCIKRNILDDYVGIDDEMNVYIGLLINNMELKLIKNKYLIIFHLSLLI